MDVRNLKFFAEACGGELRRGAIDVLIRRVCTDSRSAQAGDLFVPIVGERHDAHDYISDVALKGIAAVLVNRKRVVPEVPDCAIVAVDDTRKALGAMARRYRQDFTLPVIAVGGSNGKTTTKELIASVLRQGRSTLWSEASFNNDIGVPLTLLRLESRHEAAVLEAGTNHPGELAPLLDMIKPALGVITNIGREHLEFFGDVEGVVAEESAVGKVLSADGVLFLNGDNPWTARLAEQTRARVVRVGAGDGCEWRVTAIRLDPNGTTFQVQSSRADFNGEYRVQLVGRHQACNALFAIAIGAELGLNVSEIRRGLAECQPPKMRLQTWDYHGVRVLDDAYNANADSVIAALETLRDLPCKGRRVAVLGDMAELGPHTEQAHEEIGRRAAELGVEQLFAIGRMAPVLARAARGAGLNRVLEFFDVEPAAEAIRRFVRDGDVLLLKASRSSRLERVADLLRADSRKN